MTKATHTQSGFIQYKTYLFKDKDPMIDKIRTVLQEAFPGQMKGVKISYERASEESGVSAAAIYNWMEGETRRPHFASLCAVARACGYDLELVEKHPRRSNKKNGHG